MGGEDLRPVKACEGDWKATVKAAVDLTPRELLTQLSRYHDPGFFTCCPHNPRAQAIWHDSAHQLAECTDTIKHIHLKKVADDDD